MLGIAVDPGRLYDGDDPLFELWLMSVVDKVHATKRSEQTQKGGG